MSDTAFTIYSDENVTVITDDYVTPGGLRFPQGIFKVTFTKGLGLLNKTFKGESAWSNSRRYVEDSLDKVGIRVYLNW